MTVRIINADVFDGLRQLPDESVHCVVTSPPYWSLRDYQVAGQIGLEPTLAEHLDALVRVFREVRRVLRKDGVVFLNYGDCYAASPNGRSAADTKSLGNDDRTFRDKPISTVGPIHAELASTEHDATRSTGKENYRPAHGKRIVGRLVKWDRKSERSGHNLNGPDESVANHRIMHGGILKPKDRLLLPARVAIALHEDGWWIRDEIIWHKPNPMPSSVRDRTTCAHEMIYMLTKSARYYYDADAIAEPIAESSKARYAQASIDEQQGGFKQDLYEQHGLNTGRARSRRPNEIIKDLAKKHNNYDEKPVAGEKWGARHEGWKVQQENGVATANKRSVWTVPTEPFPDAHFATFPTALIKPCILAGCPHGGTVLDPFFGSGTTGLVADQLGRNCIGIELNPEYAALAEKRVKGDCPMFTEVSA